ncbi:DUF305 domain-containing protein [Inquilinus sp. Marseille-Q2685]|uniref:CopM family metallochaperone n=1 Tax=Inquilinus sp. Marseille-Q2685 TaxID=2866581 RepID=UPI001CE47D8D|nr:DUF305 domain-containing protein [Inquilinus sp. Marseille-Q2685]
MARLAVPTVLVAALAISSWAVVQLAEPRASSAQSMDHSTMPGMSSGSGMMDSPASKAMMEAMGRMQTSMSGAMTGNPDVDFAQGMIPHHQGAIDMARIELQYGTDPELKKLAGEIVAAQEKEIAFLKDWLAKRGK